MDFLQRRRKLFEKRKQAFAIGNLYLDNLTFQMYKQYGKDIMHFHLWYNLHLYLVLFYLVCSG